MPTALPIDALRLDSGTQSRVKLNFETIEDYAELMKSGVEFDPIRVVFDGEQYYVLDGFHRTKAAKLAGFDQIAAELTNGTLDDALWECTGANKAHGLQRSRADKRHAVEMALLHPRSQGLSNHAIAEHVGGVTAPTVAKVRAELETTGKLSSQTVRVGRDGRAITVANIGGQPKADDGAWEPPKLGTTTNHFRPIYDGWRSAWPDTSLVLVRRWALLVALAQDAYMLRDRVMPGYPDLGVSGFGVPGGTDYMHAIKLEGAWVPVLRQRCPGLVIVEYDSLEAPMLWLAGKAIAARNPMVLCDRGKLPPDAQPSPYIPAEAAPLLPEPAHQHELMRATLESLYDQHEAYGGWIGEMNLKLYEITKLHFAGLVAVCTRRGPSGGMMRWWQITPAGCAVLNRPALGVVPEPPAHLYPGIDVVQGRVAVPAVAAEIASTEPAKIFQQNIPPAESASPAQESAVKNDAEIAPPEPPARVVHFHSAADHWNALSEEWEDGRYVYIGRAVPRHSLPESPWHNPYKIIGADTPAARQQVIDLYRQHITPKIESGEVDLESLRGRTLVCWCKSASAPDTPCHGDVLVALLAAKDAAGAKDAVPVIEPMDMVSIPSGAAGIVTRISERDPDLVFLQLISAEGRPYDAGWSRDQLTLVEKHQPGGPPFVLKAEPPFLPAPAPVESAPAEEPVKEAPESTPDAIAWLPPLPWKVSTTNRGVVTAADGTDVCYPYFNNGAGPHVARMFVELFNAAYAPTPEDALGEVKPGDSLYYLEWAHGSETGRIWRRVRVENLGDSRVQIYHPVEKKLKYVERKSLSRNPFGVPLPAPTAAPQPEPEAEHAPAL